MRLLCVQADKEQATTALAEARVRLEEATQALAQEREERTSLEGRVKAVVAQAVRVAESQRDAAQAAAVAAAERALKEAQQRDAEADKVGGDRSASAGAARSWSSMRPLPGLGQQSGGGGGSVGVGMGGVNRASDSGSTGGRGSSGSSSRSSGIGGGAGIRRVADGDDK